MGPNMLHDARNTKRSISRRNNERRRRSFISFRRGKGWMRRLRSDHGTTR